MTGQGPRTKAFLAMSDAREGREDTFFSSNSSECISVFAQGIAWNRACAALQPELNWDPEDERLPPQATNMIQISNSVCYGSACNLLKLHPTRRRNALAFLLPPRFSLREKFGPLFSKPVFAAYVGLLGPMLNQDPETYTGKRPTWLEALQAINRLGIDGLKDSLIALQTANDLVHLNVCSPPDVATISTWIWEHPGLGAFKGLASLGFKLLNRDHVRVAFQCIYDHLDRQLSMDDKRDLGFGTIFVEHLLCKCKRWTKRVPTLMDWARRAEEANDWFASVHGEHWQSIPSLCDSISHIEEVINSFLVCLFACVSGSKFCSYPVKSSL